MALIFLRINQGLAGRDADHNGALWHVPGHNRISTHASTRTDDNGPQYLRSRTHDRAIANGGVPLARDSVRRVRSAQGPALINGRSEEPTSELPSLMRISSAVFCLK